MESVNENIKGVSKDVQCGNWQWTKATYWKGDNIVALFKMRTRKKAVNYTCESLTMALGTILEILIRSKF